MEFRVFEMQYAGIDVFLAEKIAEDMGAPELPSSGRQEYLQSIVNGIMFR